MKYANIVFNKRGDELTIGDDIQLLAIENLYKYMGINYDDVVRIERTDLQTYNGEMVVLPVTFPFTAYYDDLTITCFSEKIIPVFLGLCIFSKVLNQKDVNYLKKFAPIGCRDEYTLETMKKYNIPAYLNACMTLTFPRSTKNRNNLKRIFCIDVQEELIPYIPEEILKDCEFSSHSYLTSDIEGTPEEYARKIYEMYRNEAKLVITSRLHAASPCTAAGIPVIFAKDIFSYRFAGVDRFLKVYTADEFSEIDWYPSPVEYEDKKEMLLELAAERVRDAFNQGQKINQWHAFMQMKQSRNWYVEFLDNTIEYISKKWDKDKQIEYALWGVTQIATCVQDYIETNYPKAKLKAVIDRNKRISIFNVESKDKSILEEKKVDYVFVCTGAAVKEAKEYLPKVGINEYYNCCEVISKTN